MKGLLRNLEGHSSCSEDVLSCFREAEVFQHSNKFVVFLFFWLFGMCARTSDGKDAASAVLLQRKVLGFPA